MQTFFRWGIEGEHFKKAGKGAEFINRTAYENEIAPLKQLQIYYPTSGGLPPADPTAIQEKLMRIQQGEALKHLVVDATIGIDSPTYTETRGELKQLRRDAWIKFVAGKIDENSYWDGIQAWLDAGGAQAKKEFTEQYKAYKQ